MKTVEAIELHPAFARMCEEIEQHVGKYSLADAIREGKKYLEQTHSGWNDGERVCALSAAAMVLKARNEPRG